MITIAWDIDCTLNDYILEILKYINYHRGTNFQLNDTTHYNLTKCLPFQEKEIWGYLDNFKLEGKYILLKPNSEILQWLKKYGDNFHHIALTACSVKTASISAQWLFTYLGNWFRGFYFVPSNRDEKHIEYDKNKIEWLKRHKVDIYIEDNEDNYLQAKKLGIECYLIKQPWNNGEPVKEILKKITRRIK
jgi:uncharacterized HAD superfamily protein